VNFMRFVAQHLREIMAQLGFRKLEDMVGRVDMLEPKAAIDHWKAKGFDFSGILYAPDAGPEVGRFQTIQQDHGLDKSLDVTTLLKICEPAIERGEQVTAELEVRNVNRVVGTITGSEITRKHGAKGLPDDTVQIKFKGSAGQSFGAFMPNGMSFALEGDANDYFGKGLSGGKLAVFPSPKATFASDRPTFSIACASASFTRSRPCPSRPKAYRSMRSCRCRGRSSVICSGTCRRHGSTISSSSAPSRWLGS